MVFEITVVTTSNLIKLIKWALWIYINDWDLIKTFYLLKFLNLYEQRAISTATYSICIISEMSEAYCLL